MKTLFIAAHFPPKVGGTATLYYNLCKRARPEEIAVLTTTKSHFGGADVNFWKEFDSAQRFRIYRTPLLFPEQNPHEPSRPNIFMATLRFAIKEFPLLVFVLMKVLWLVNKEKIDLLVCGEVGRSGWLALAVKKLANKKYIVYVHGEEITTACSGRVWGKETVHVLKNANRLIAISDFTRDKLIDMGISKEKIRLVYNGVDDIAFQPQKKDKELVRKYGLEGKKVLLTVSRLDRRKGHDSVLRAMTKILKEIPDLAYLIVGSGLEKDNLKRLVNELSLQKYVIFTGFVPDEELVSYYNLCDVFIMPNRELSNGDTEGFGIVFLEANACGKPVIGGRCGGVSSAIEEGKSGYLVNGNNLEEITKIAIMLLKDQSLAENIGIYGRNRSRLFSWDMVENNFQELCRDIILQN